MPLSDTRIRSLKASEQPYKLTDGEGLYLEVRPSGACLWRYRYRIGGKENVYAIGQYPEITLKQARELRNQARKLVREGVHPARHRKRERARRMHEEASTFRAVAAEWLNARKAGWTARTYRQRKSLLERDVFPVLGSIPMRQVTRADGLAVIRRIERRAPQMALLAKQALGDISRLALDTERADIELTYRQAVRTKPTQHKSPLQPSEIPRFFESLERYPGYFPTKGAIRLLWLTLARPKEVLEARWNEFDLDEQLWVIPAERMKMRLPHRVPLPTQAVEVLKQVRVVSGGSEYLVPNRIDLRRPASHTLLVKAFIAMGYNGKFSPHGVRVTGRTLLGEQGHPRDVLERQLAHREAKHVRAYDQGDRLEARRTVMQGWADYLDALCTGGEVVNLRRLEPTSKSN